ncbi:MAG: protease, partial [Candidatus Symbiothrix sp.]|nr:protease [Candidatus Symbiothrix sp.]
MKTRTKFFLVVIALSVCCIPLFAQISEGGLPPSFQYEKKGSSLRASDSNEAHIILPINFDVKQLIAEDKEAEAAGESINCAKIIPVDLTMENSGVWSTLSNGQEVWQLTIEAPKAIALLLYYRDFYIPQGGKLFIYNKEKTQVLGAYNHTTNAAGRGFATEFVAGDLLTLEYVSPTGEASVDLPRIRIEGVSYGYNHLNVYTREKEGEEAATYPCYVNIVCSPEGDDWQNEAAGVVRIIFRKMTGTSSLCSGSMINNTKGDFAPYMLTAFHCVRETDASTLDQAVFYYNYNSASCSSNTAPATTQTVAGAQAKVETGDGYSDGALLLLNSNVPESYNPYFNGWDVTGTVVTGTMGIHHPAGDVKKISYSEFAVTHTKWTGDLVDGTHWRVPKYTETPNGKSIVEGGSSGSPLFSVGEHLIIGTLHGGHTVEVCENFELRYSSYGKLWFDWDQMTNPDLHMKTYLDPESTGALKLPGSAYTSTGTYTVTFSVTDGADGTPITNARITFNDVTNAAGNYTFTGVTAPR